MSPSTYASRYQADSPALRPASSSSMRVASPPARAARSGDAESCGAAMSTAGTELPRAGTAATVHTIPARLSVANNTTRVTNETSFDVMPAP